MTKDLIEAVVKKIDWLTLETEIQNRFTNAHLTSVDMMTTRSYINSIIESALTIYVDSQFMHQFKIEIAPLKDQRCPVTLSHNGRVLAEWTLVLAEYLFY